MQIRWEGVGVEEKGYWLNRHSGEGRNPGQSNTPIVAVDPRYFRPTEVETLLGDPAKAKAKLGWTPRITFGELVAEMVREDLNSAERDELIKRHGYKAMDYHE
jgi:GDPmannose 4,6-dehydratase